MFYDFQWNPKLFSFHPFFIYYFYFFLHTMKVIEADISTEEIHTSLEQHKCQ